MRTSEVIQRRLRVFEAPAQLPELMLLQKYDRGEASSVLITNPATRLQYAKNKGFFVAIAGPLSSLTMLHHGVCDSAFVPHQEVRHSNGKTMKADRQIDPPQHALSLENKIEGKGAMLENCRLSRCCTRMFAIPPSYHIRRWDIRTG